MAIRDWYVDNTAGNDTTGDGLAWATGYKTIAKVVNTPLWGAGDTIRCTLGATSTAEVLTAAINSTVVGLTTNYNQIIGYNWNGGTPINDGTMYKINGNSAVANCITSGTSKNYHWLENLECYGATGAGILSGTTSLYWIAISCIARNNGAEGINFNSSSYSVCYKCKAYSNTGRGFRSNNIVLLLCHSYSNSLYGFDLYGGTAMGCLGCDNTGASGAGIYMTQYSRAFNCVMDGNATKGIDLGTAFQVAIGNRSTNNATGLNFAAATGSFEDFNFVKANTNDIVLNTTGIRFPIYSRSVVGSGTEGYTNRAGKIYNLSDTATLRRTADKVGGV